LTRPHPLAEASKASKASNSLYLLDTWSNPMFVCEENGQKGEKEKEKSEEYSHDAFNFLRLTYWHFSPTANFFFFFFTKH
jgi:hypothetical protein